eukprot:gnl/MRDRNA2_/MRDRNA2_87488_c0_seq1.p1 gnl/MRDRNA2_/MRDRNA2_87488_c0~~gnl/MRDRNA2_/MRDRNA2_87488_c0_seq1.p1  ORF type:complete len:202 (+),score=52.21 gnl/MRDRNA2_/MRDRNA2_87488_c0_seq1:74-679(+)
MATCAGIETSGTAWSSKGCIGRLAPPCIDLAASNEVSGPAVCFQIGTPTADAGDCHFIGTPTKESMKLKNQDEDECFECDDSDNESRLSDDDSDCESEADTEASPVRSASSMATGKQLSWNDVADRNKIKRPSNPTVPQEPNWKLEAACHLAGQKGYAARFDIDDSSDDESDDELLGCRRDNLDDDFEVGSIASIDSDIEL